MIVRVTTTGLTLLAEKFDRRANAISKTAVRELLRESATELISAYKAKIATFTPGPVRDLAESTKKQKTRQVGFIYPILIRSGYFLSSMRSVVRNVSRGVVLAIKFEGTHPGGATNEQIAKAHIQGTSRVAKRDFTAIPAQWRDTLIQRLRDRVRQA